MKFRSHKIEAFGFDVSHEPRHGVKVLKHAAITEVSLMSDGSYELGFLPASKADR